VALAHTWFDSGAWRPPIHELSSIFAANWALYPDTDPSRIVAVRRRWPPKCRHRSAQLQPRARSSLLALLFFPVVTLALSPIVVPTVLIMAVTVDYPEVIGRDLLEDVLEIGRPFPVYGRPLPRGHDTAAAAAGWWSHGAVGNIVDDSHAAETKSFLLKGALRSDAVVDLLHEVGSLPEDASMYRRALGGQAAKYKIKLSHSSKLNKSGKGRPHHVTMSTRRDDGRHWGYLISGQATPVSRVMTPLVAALATQLEALLPTSCSSGSYFNSCQVCFYWYHEIWVEQGRAPDTLDKFITSRISMRFKRRPSLRRSPPLGPLDAHTRSCDPKITVLPSATQCHSVLSMHQCFSVLHSYFACMLTHAVAPPKIRVTPAPISSSP
jgi:hypothetical protein